MNVKIPVTHAGIKAIEAATYQGVSVNATVSFTVPQMIAVAEAVERGLQRRDAEGLDTAHMAPVCTMMIGRLDDWMQVLVKRDEIDIDPACATWAGIAAFKKAYGIFQERGYRTRALAAAYRHLGHWSELIGGDVVLTMPYEWAVKANGSDIPVVERMQNPVDPQIVDELYTQDPGFPPGLRRRRDDHRGVRRLRRDRAHAAQLHRFRTRPGRGHPGLHAAQSGRQVDKRAGFPLGNPAMREAHRQMSGRSVSIQDIAQAAGVSHATVSRALRGSSLISAEVRENIQRLAGQMGYTPNAVAQSLKGQRTNTIGLVVTSIADPFYGRLVRGVDEVARQVGRGRVSRRVVQPRRRRNGGDRVVPAPPGRRDHHGFVPADARSSWRSWRGAERRPCSSTARRKASIPGFAPCRSTAMRVDSKPSATCWRSGTPPSRTWAPRTGRPRTASAWPATATRWRKRGIEVKDGWIQQASPERRTYSDDVEDGEQLMLEALRHGITAAFCYNDMHAVGALLSVPQARHRRARPGQHRGF